MSKSLRLSTQSILTLEDESQKQSETISYLRLENKEFDRVICQFNVTLADGAKNSYSLKEDYIEFSNTVNKTFENVQENQKIQRFQLTKLKSQSGNKNNPDM